MNGGAAPLASGRCTASFKRNNTCTFSSGTTMSTRPSGCSRRRCSAKAFFARWNSVATMRNHPKESPIKGGSYPPRPQARAEEIAARGFSADEAPGCPWRSGKNRAPHAVPALNFAISMCCRIDFPMLPRIPRTLTCDNVRRAGNSSPRRPCYRLGLQHGLAPYIAHSFFPHFQSASGWPGMHPRSTASSEQKVAPRVHAAVSS